MNPRSLALLVILLVATACAPADAGRVDTGRTADALALLRDWDDRRAQAWTEGDLAALADLYTATSRTGRRDRAMLAAYSARGLRVRGLHTQVIAASLRVWAPGRVTLEVTDRVVGAQAVGRGAAIPLPRDRPSTWRVSMHRVAGTWRVAEVRPAPPSAPR